MAVQRYMNISTDVEVDIADVLEDMNDETLAHFGLQEKGKSDALFTLMYIAAEKKNIPDLLKLVELLAWQEHGRILVTK